MHSELIVFQQVRPRITERTHKRQSFISAAMKEPELTERIVAIAGKPLEFV
jgi:hypothetical protein